MMLHTAAEYKDGLHTTSKQSVDTTTRYMITARMELSSSDHEVQILACGEMKTLPAS